jgi:hypothetical protein
MHGRVASEQMRVSGLDRSMRALASLQQRRSVDGTIERVLCQTVVHQQFVPLPVRRSVASYKLQQRSVMMHWLYSTYDTYVRTSRGPAGRPEWSKAYYKSSSSAALPASSVVALVALLPYCVRMNCASGTVCPFWLSSSGTRRTSIQATDRRIYETCHLCLSMPNRTRAGFKKKIKILNYIKILNVYIKYK